MASIHDEQPQLTRLQELLARDGVRCRYMTVLGYVRAGPTARPRRTVRVAESQTGEVEEIAFGRLGITLSPLVGAAPGRVLTCDAAGIAVLQYRRKCLTSSVHNRKFVVWTERLGELLDVRRAVLEANRSAYAALQGGDRGRRRPEGGETKKRLADSVVASTGGWGRLGAVAGRALAAARLPIVVVNPRQVRDFAKGDRPPG